MNRHDRGIMSEDKTEEALHHLKSLLEQKPGRYNIKCKIVRIERTEHFSDLDLKGVDFIVTLENGRKILMQVKNSITGKNHFERRRGPSSLFINVIVVHITDIFERVVHKVAECIKFFLNNLQRIVAREKFNSRMHIPRRHWNYRPQAHMMGW